VASSSLLVLKSQKLEGDFKVIARTKAFYHILQVSFHILHLLLTFYSIRTILIDAQYALIMSYYAGVD
jgi:hypothetical protein